MTTSDTSGDGGYVQWLGAQLKQRRLERTLTQEALGELACVHRTTIGRFERGQGGTTTTLVRLARALDLNPEELLPL
jgi:transcriptional regulator with XRE-family HTH domain